MKFFVFPFILYVLFYIYLTMVLLLGTGMATSQLTAPSISARIMPSFEGFKPSTVKFTSVDPSKAAAWSRKSLRGLVVRAATVVAPKVYK